MAGKVGMTRAAVMGAMGGNAVPVAGTLLGGWPPETTLTVYLAETLLLVMITAARLRLLAPERLATQSGRQQSRAEFIQGFLILCGGFAGVAGVFNAFFLWQAIDVDVTLRALTTSLPVFVLIELLLLLGDLVVLRRASQPVAEAWAVRSMRRVFVLYFAIWFGLAAAFFGFEWFIWPFIGLKLLMEVGVALEQAFGRLGDGPGQAAGLPEIKVTKG